MRYLTLAAEYTQSPLRDDFVGPVIPEEIGLSESLGNRIREWNERYKAIVPLDEAQRKGSRVSQLIDSLDDEGIKLVTAIEGELPDAKVRYFSEGQLRHIP